MNRATFAIGLAGAHHRLAHLVHHGADIREVEIDQTWAYHQIRDAFDALIKHIIGHREGFGEGGLLVGEAEQVLVRDDDQRIDNFLKLLNALISLTHPLRAFELEGLGDDTHGQNAKFACGLRNDRCRAGAGPAAHTCGDKRHMRARQVVDDIFDAFLCGARADGWPGTGAETFGHARAHLNARRGGRLGQRLRVGIGDDELTPVQRLVDHVIDRVAASAPHAKDCDARFQIRLIIRQGEIQCHKLCPPVSWIRAPVLCRSAMCCLIFMRDYLFR